MQINAENINAMSNKLNDVHATLDNPPGEVASEVDPTDWSTIGSIMQRDVIADFQSTHFWGNHLMELREWKVKFQDAKKKLNEFQTAVSNLCAEFKGDLLYLFLFKKNYFALCTFIA